jgi:hypothetical protein
MLLNYFTFHEKNQVVSESVLIKDKKSFESLISSLMESHNRNKLKWRGMHEANLKLSNSCQRYYSRVMNNDSSEIYFEFVRNLVNYVSNWNKYTIQRYLESQNIENDIVAIMTLMQHFGFPTPLLDFSDDPLIALYFSSMPSLFDEDEEDIKNYSSLYSIDTTIESLKEFNEKYRINKTPYSDQFAPIFSTSLLLISKDTQEFQLGTNFNITNQEGSFIYFNDPVRPLEDILASIPETKSSLKCYHIHKRFNSEIRTFLEKGYGITQDYVFPNPYQMIADFHKGKFSIF